MSAQWTQRIVTAEDDSVDQSMDSKSAPIFHGIKQSTPSRKRFHESCLQQNQATICVIFCSCLPVNSTTSYEGGRRGGLQGMLGVKAGKAPARSARDPTLRVLLQQVIVARKGRLLVDN